MNCISCKWCWFVLLQSKSQQQQALNSRGCKNNSFISPNISLFLSPLHLRFLPHHRLQHCNGTAGPASSSSRVFLNKQKRDKTKYFINILFCAPFRCTFRELNAFDFASVLPLSSSSASTASLLAVADINYHFIHCTKLDYKFNFPVLRTESSLRRQPCIANWLIEIRNMSSLSKNYYWFSNLFIFTFILLILRVLRVLQSIGGRSVGLRFPNEKMKTSFNNIILMDFDLFMSSLRMKCILIQL